VASKTTALAQRYASALYELAEDAKALDDVAADLRGLKSLLAESDDLVRLVRSPIISRAEQGRAMAAVLDKAGAHPLTKKVVGVAANGDIADAFLAELAKRRGEVTADVTAATKLSDDEVSQVTEALRAVVGQKVQVNTVVDPSIIGGLIVRVGSRMFDSSLRTKMQRLQFAMKGTG
jgi:F-type H+-transporting ATPase subunit delta